MTAVEPPVVQTTAGRVRGAANAAGTVLSFRGIPFAAPPVGPRRFAAAAPAEPWDGVRDATAPGPAAPQVYGLMDELFGEPELPTSEADALHLTVYTPDLAGRRPVFVWIHGGSFVSGSSALETYDTEHFARDGLVSVGINYRLGAFGFLDLVGLFPGTQCANPALTDAIMALRWIQENIARFGGDPDAVTIAGESAGAGMVTALLASPLAAGLFHRAIPQSGINFRVQSPDDARRIAENFLSAAGVTPGDREALESLTTERVLEISENRETLLAGVEGTRLAWNMHQDPETLPRNVYDRLAAGELAHIDMLLGTTADENKLRWLVEEPAPELVAAPALDAELLDRLRTLYREEGRGKAAWEIDEAIGNDLSYLVPTTWAAEEHARTGGRTYMYMFTWRSPSLGGRLGSCHAMENAFVFDRLGPSPALHGDDPPQSLADAMHRAWVAFTASGDPVVAETGPWPRYDVESPQVMEFGDRIGLLADPRGRERRAWIGQPATRFGVG